MATWPAALPNGWMLGTPLRIDTGISRATMRSGRVRQRVNITKPFDTYNARLELADEEFRLFEYFMRDVVNQEDWYTGPYHDGGGAQTGTLRVVGGAWTAQQQDGGLWTVSAQIEIDGRK